METYKRFSLKSLIFLVFILINTEIKGQEQFLFRNYTVNQGISSNTIRCILQDHKGFMWFGTKSGLNRFDGTKIKVYQQNKNNPESIGSDFIHSLAIIDGHNIWVGTDKGIFILNLKTEKFKPFSLLGEILAYDIIKDKKGRVWIATHSKGIYCFDPKTKKLRNFDTAIGSLGSIVPARKLALDTSGNIWIATDSKGIIVLDPDQETTKNYNTDNSNISSNEILSLYCDLKGTIWIGTMSAGLSKHENNGRFYNYKKDDQSGLNNNIIRSIYQPSPDKIFVGTERGLNVLDLKSNKFTPYIHEHNNNTSISDNAVYSISGDREGGIWLGTYFGGVNYLRQPSAGIERYLPTGNANHLSGRAVSCFLEDETGKIWIGTEDAGLNYFDPETKKFKQYPFLSKQKSLPYNNVHVLTKDARGLIWIGMFSGGVAIYNPATAELKTYKNIKGDLSSLSSNTIYSIYEDKEKRIWIGTINGLNIYDPDTDSFIRVADTERHSIYGINEDNNRMMWFATNNYGLISKNKNTGEWQRYPSNGKNGNLSSPKLLCILNDQNGNLWLGTEGGGLNKFSLKSKKVEVIDEKKGLPAKVIYSLVVDKNGNIWIATEKGLYIIDVNTQKIRQKSIWDGTSSLVFNYQAGYNSSKGFIYFGGTNGFGFFHPDSIKNNKISTQVVLSNFQIFNQDIVPLVSKSPLTKTITYTDTITLAHDQSVINIEYAGLSYLSPEKINYAYKMVGVDKSWNNVGNHQKAGYTNLSPGEYTFKVKAYSDSEKNIFSETSLKIIILPPFYRTLTAYIIYLLLILGAFVGLRNYYRKKHQQENELRLERLRIKNEKEFYNQKIDFFTMMAHEVRTPLSLIAGPVEKLLESEGFSGNTRQQLETIDKNTNRLSTLVNQLLDFRRIESDFYELHHEEVDVVMQIKTIYDSFASAALHHRGLDFTWNSAINHLHLKIDPEALTKVLSNIIINALKFARTKVSITLLMDKTHKLGTCLAIRVEDDGIGIPPEELDNIFKKFFKVSSGAHQYNNLGGTGIGLALAKSLTEKLGGELEVFSQEGKHTIFTVFLPCPPDSLTKPVSLHEETTHPVNHEEASILIVEDNHDLQQFIEDNLKSEGYHTLAANSVNEALQLLELHDINLIISDVMLPDKSGIDLCRIIKEDISRCHIPFLILTAKTDSNTELAGIGSGADVYMVKPFKVKHLLVRIKNLLENRKMLMQKYNSYPLPSEIQPSVKSRDQIFIERVVKFIEEHISEPNLSVESLSTEMAMSKSAFLRKIKALTDNSPNEFTRLIRLKYAAKLLLSNEYRISEIGYMSGFSSHSYFSRCFYDHFQVTPSDYIEQHINKQ